MKKENKTALTFIIATLVAVVALYFISLQNTPNNPNNESYVAGYDKESIIKITTLNEKEIKTEIITVKNSEKNLLPHKTIDTDVIFNVNNGHHIYDVTAADSDGIMTFNFENLPLESKVSLTFDGQPVHQNIPVDWVGNLTLETTKTVGNVCSLINQKEKICYNTNDGGLS